MRCQGEQRHSRLSGTLSKMAAGCFSRAACRRRGSPVFVHLLGGVGGVSNGCTVLSLSQALQRALLEGAASGASRESAAWDHCDLALSLKNWCALPPQCRFVTSICVSGGVILRRPACVSWRADVSRAPIWRDVSESREVWSDKVKM